MVNLKMNEEDCKLLVKVLMKFTGDHRPIKYGGQFTNHPPVNEEEWVRLTELIDVLYHNKNK